MNSTTAKTPSTVVITPHELLLHWQGHRALTRRVIEAFPEKEFFNHRIGGMRSFADMTMELLSIAGPGIREIATGDPEEYPIRFDHGGRKAAILARWDENTAVIDTFWPKITAERFHDKIKAFGNWEGTVLSTILYYIDNEIHHRGQGYVYLRSLDIEPPAFWER